MPFCRECGTETEPFHRYCRNCGAEIGTGATEIGASEPVSQGMAPVLPYERSEGNVDVIPAGQRLRFVNTIVDTIISSLVNNQRQR